MKKFLIASIAIMSAAMPLAGHAQNSSGTLTSLYSDFITEFGFQEVGFTLFLLGATWQVIAINEKESTVTIAPASR